MREPQRFRGVEAITPSLGWGPRRLIPIARLFAASSALAIALAVASPAAAEPRARVLGEMDDDLRERIERAVGDVEAPAANRFQARRRARDAVEDAVAVLRSEGYYGAVVEDDIEGESPPVPVIRVTPGPRFLVADPRLEWIDPPPEAEVAAEAAEAIELEPGEPGRAADVVAAEGRVVARLAALGYADAVAGDRRVVVDHADTSLQPTYRIDAGPLVRLDGVELNTQGRTNPRWVERLAPWTAGERYRPESVAELERRLLETNVYDSVTIALAPPDRTTAEGLRPVIVSLSDQPRRVLEAGVGFSTSEGAGIDGVWTWRNRFGRADTLRFDARLAEIDSRIGAELSLPHWRRPGRTLKLGASVIDEDTDAYDRTVAGVRFDIQQRIAKTSFFNYGLALEGGRYNEVEPDPVTRLPISVERDLVILTAQTGASLDYSNDPLDPTTGWRVSVDAQPTFVTGEDSVGFLRVQGQVSAYLPVEDDARTVVAGRVRLGSIVGGSIEAIPSDRLFYSGGGGSVRGFSYQGVGPRLADNTPLGGLSLFETSLEVRRRFGRRWGAVAFVDAGSVGEEETPDFGDLRYAVGAGVRYNLPFGPIRADIAFPVNKHDGDPDFQIYVSIGQAF